MFSASAWCGPTDIKKTIENYPASESKEHLLSAVDMIIAGDNAASETMITSGKIIILRVGLDVYVVDTDLWNGLVKIRPVGTIFELWTVDGALSE